METPNIEDNSAKKPSFLSTLLTKYKGDISLKKLQKFAPFAIFLLIFIYVVYTYNNSVFSFLPSTSKDNTVQLLFRDKRYTKDFKKIYDSSYSSDILGFEENEGWKGELTFDETNMYDGLTSLALTSKDHITNTVSVEKNLNLESFDIIKILIYIPKDEENVESAIIRFGNKLDSQYFEYPLNVKKGWNVASMPKSSFSSNAQPTNGSTINWSNIEKVSISVTARKNTKVDVNFDRLWAEKNTEITKTIFKSLVPASENVTLKSFQGKVYPNMWNIGSHFTALKKITSVKDFSYTAKLIPQKIGWFGIVGRMDTNNGYGYYLEFDGINAGTWKLYRYGAPIDMKPWVILDQGAIANFTIEKDQPVWMKMEMYGSKIIGSFSTDGENFTKLTETTNNEFESGSLGFGSGGSSFLIEGVNFSQ